MSYCSNVYLCLLWRSFKYASWKSITVAFNNAFRIILKLNRRCSASAMFVNNNVNSCMEIHRKMVFSFLRRIQQSHNFLVSCILRSDCFISIVTNMAPYTVLSNLVWFYTVILLESFTCFYSCYFYILL